MRSLVPYANSWEEVLAPLGMNIPVPFSIQKAGRLYRVDPNFDIQARANITVTTTYYVDSVNGNDSNNGLTPETALKTLTAANSKGDADRIYVARNSIFQKNQRPTGFSRSMEIIDYGTGEKPIITSLINNQIGTFTQTSNYYSATAGDFVALLVDKSILDVNGNPTAYTKKTSIAEVDAEAGSFYWNASTIYVRTLDDRAPDSDLMYYDSIAYRLRADGLTQFFKNIKFGGGAQFEPNTSAGGTKVYFKDCEFSVGNEQFWGLDECIIQDCDGWAYGGDVFNLDDKLGNTGYIYEVNCTLTNYNNGDPTSQCSTLHNTACAIRIGGTYQNAAGQIVADVGTGKAWIMGMKLDNGGADVTTYFENTAWLEGNTITGDPTSIYVSPNGAVYYFNNSLEGIVDNNNIYEPYLNVDPIIAGYIVNVEPDGGTIDSEACLTSTFNNYNAITIPLYDELVAYQELVLAASGTLESKLCVRNNFITLNNIAV